MPHYHHCALPVICRPPRSILLQLPGDRQDRPHVFLDRSQPEAGHLAQEISCHLGRHMRMEKSLTFERGVGEVFRWQGILRGHYAGSEADPILSVNNLPSAGFQFGARLLRTQPRRGILLFQLRLGCHAGISMRGDPTSFWGARERLGGTYAMPRS